MPTDDRKSNESEKSATRPHDDQIRDLPSRDESDREVRDENVKGGFIRQKPALE